MLLRGKVATAANSKQHTKEILRYRYRQADTRPCRVFKATPYKINVSKTIPCTRIHKRYRERTCMHYSKYVCKKEEHTEYKY